MKASDIQHWPDNISASEWPDGVLENMEAGVLTECIFPMRKDSGVPMWPSSLYGAHIRETGTSQHSIEGGKLARATDMHVKTYSNLLKAFNAALANPAIGGIGLYFDTNTPMIHVDTRPNRIMWVRIDGKYIYAHKNPMDFYKAIAEGAKAW